MPAPAGRDTIVARVDVARGTRVSALRADGTWAVGTVTAKTGDTLQLDGGRSSIPLRGLRELRVATGEHEVSGTRILFTGLCGIAAGFAVGGLAYAIVDPCGPSTGNPDADFCLDALGYMAAGVGVGLLGGLLIGSTPAEKWVRIYPVPEDSRSSSRMRPGELWQPKPRALE